MIEICNDGEGGKLRGRFGFGAVLAAGPLSHKSAAGFIFL